MISRHQYRFLKWLSDNPCERNEIGDYLEFDPIALNQYLFQTGKYINKNGYVYYVNEFGKAVIVEYRHYRLSELRNWITTVIALAAFVMSVISLTIR